MSGGSNNDSVDLSDETIALHRSPDGPDFAFYPKTLNRLDVILLGQPAVADPIHHVEFLTQREKRL
jgi:hypothetical protein